MADQQPASDHHTLEDIVPGARFLNRAFGWDLQILEIDSEQTVIFRDPLGTGKTLIAYLLSGNYVLRHKPSSNTKEIAAH